METHNPKEEVMTGTHPGTDLLANPTSTRSTQPLKYQAIGIKRQRPAPLGTERFSKAGEGARTLDIHVGNVTLYH